MNYYQLLKLRAERHRSHLKLMDNGKHKISLEQYQQNLKAYLENANAYYRYKATGQFKRIITNGFKNTFKPFKSRNAFWDDLFFFPIRAFKELFFSIGRTPKALWYLGQAIHSYRKKDGYAPQYGYYSLRTFLQFLFAIAKIILIPAMIIRALIIRPIITLKDRRTYFREDLTLKQLAYQQPDPALDGRDSVYIALALQHHLQKAKKHRTKYSSKSSLKTSIENPPLIKSFTTFQNSGKALDFKDNALLSNLYETENHLFARMEEHDFKTYQLNVRAALEDREDLLRNKFGLKKRN